MGERNWLLGLASALLVLLIWAGFIVISRLGAKTSLTPYDITALRFIVSGALVLPFYWHWWPRRLPLRSQLMLALCGPGVVYSLLMYHGLEQASAVYAGVFANGTMPIFVLLIGFLVAQIVPSRSQVIGIVVIISGALFVSFAKFGLINAEIGFAIVFFLVASLVLAYYIFGLQHWKLHPLEALVLVNLPNAVLFLPLWLLFCPSNLWQVDTTSIITQALFQGLGPGFFAILLMAYATRHIGSIGMAGFTASVPACATLLAIPVLFEYPTPVDWIGVVLVTLGLLLLLSQRR